MFINQSAQTYRPMMPTSMRRRWRQKSFGLLMPKVVLVAVGKVLLLFCPVLLLANFLLSSAAERVAAEVLAAEDGRYALMDDHIKLRAERAFLYSPEYLDTAAARQFALYVPEKGQVTRF